MIKYIIAHTMGTTLDSERYLEFVNRAADRSGVFGNMVRRYDTSVNQYYHDNLFSKRFTKQAAMFARQGIQIIVLLGVLLGLIMLIVYFGR